MTSTTPPTPETTTSAARAADPVTVAAIARPTGVAAITGAVIMLVGAAFYFTAGPAADLPPALYDGTIPAYLDAVDGNTAIVANLTLWIIGATFMGAAGVGFGLLGRDRAGLAGLGAALGVIGAAIAITCFVAWLAVVVVVAPSGDALLGETMGWFAWHLDHVATALIIGFGPMLYSLAGRTTWAPGWLVAWGVVAGVVAVQSLVVPYVHVLADTALLIVPVGIGWIIAAGITVMRHGTRSGATRAS